MRFKRKLKTHAMDEAGAILSAVAAFSAAQAKWDSAELLARVATVCSTPQPSSVLEALYGDVEARLKTTQETAAKMARAAQDLARLQGELDAQIGRLRREMGVVVEHRRHAVDGEYKERLREIEEQYRQVEAERRGKIEEIDQLAPDAMNDACFPGNPREATHEDVVELFKKICPEA